MTEPRDLTTSYHRSPHREQDMPGDPAHERLGAKGTSALVVNVVLPGPIIDVRESWCFTGRLQK